ncbi:unnamed protein product [Rotaria magnacalcarata]|uniref:Uncharacterized protein n=4 Tax=Rotaria magnacalcarata TaxID=392030 RepID=A0A8S2KN18_9BILA|nr:unnamed protein product [Rotaria magnacalcarata]
MCGWLHFELPAKNQGVGAIKAGAQIVGQLAPPANAPTINPPALSAAKHVKDIVSRQSPGIGSAGAISYNLLIQGKTQALESDVVIFMKPARKSAVTTVINNPVLDQYFKHDGLRTVLCAYAMHTVTSRWLGYTTLNNQIPLFVNDVAAHSQNLDWTNINDFEDICQTAEYLGKAMAKIHCIDDVDSNDKGKNEQEYTDLIPFGTIPRHSQITIRDAIDGNDEEFIKDIVLFAMFDTVMSGAQFFIFDSFHHYCFAI